MATPLATNPNIPSVIWTTPSSHHDTLTYICICASVGPVQTGSTFEKTSDNEGSLMFLRGFIDDGAKFNLLLIE